jgi:Ca-activated chloride channel family protein
MRTSGKILITFLFLVFSTIGYSQEKKAKQLTRILFVFDASFSMVGKWQSDLKINIAQKILSEILDSLKTAQNVEIGLRVYGHQKHFQPQQDCNDTKLEVPIGKNNIEKIQQKLKTLVPKGTTPIALTLSECANDFSPCENCRNIIILITDGIEECNGDPCAVSQALQKQGIILKPFIIGIGKNFKTEFDCVGNYYDASSEEFYKTALSTVIAQALNSTTAQVNLFDSYGKPLETNVDMTFYDNFSGLVQYNLIHTLNKYGLPDTLVLDPLMKYNIVVHTLPPLTSNNVTIEPGKHTIISFNAPQGYLMLKVGGTKGIQKNPKCLVRLAGKTEIINVQNFDYLEKYLKGKYDLEVLTLPRLYIMNVDIPQTLTTTVEIPEPGVVTFEKPALGVGCILVEEKNKLNWVCNLNEFTMKDVFNLQPGNYRVIYRSKNLYSSAFSLEKKFKVESSKYITVKLY